METVALAAEALSPSRQSMSPPDRLPCSPAGVGSGSGMSPMHPAPSPLILRGGGRAGVGFHDQSIPQVLLSLGEGVVRVGVVCIVTNRTKPGCVLVGRRKGSLDAGSLGLPGE